MSLRAVPLLLVLAGCFGSFRLTTTVWEFNRDLSDSIVVQEIVFLAFVIVPVYGAATFVDAVVLNTIEALTGDNPIAAAEDGQAVEIAVDGQLRRLRRAARHLELEDGAGHVARAELTPEGGLVISARDGTHAEIGPDALRDLQETYATGGREALAAAVSDLLAARVALAP